MPYKVIHGSMRSGKTLRNEVASLTLQVQHYLQAAGNWSRPIDNYFDDYAYYKYDRHERKWFRNYNQRMAAKHMVKLYLLIRGWDGTTHTRTHC